MDLDERIIANARFQTVWVLETCVALKSAVKDPNSHIAQPGPNCLHISDLRMSGSSGANTRTQNLRNPEGHSGLAFLLCQRNRKALFASGARVELCEEDES